MRPTCERMKCEPLIGRTFGRWAVLDNGTTIKDKSGHFHRYYRCRCACGKIKLVARHSLIGGSLSCGCLSAERAQERLTTHGASRSNASDRERALLNSWSNMRRRCFNPEDQGFKNYGGRGIQVCAQWSFSFQLFYRDMEATWFPGAMIDRINNEGNYNRENCKWSTRQEQNENTRQNVKFTEDEIDWMHVYSNQLGWPEYLLAECHGCSRAPIRKALQSKSYEAAKDRKKQAAKDRQKAKELKKNN
jgi:hypothetical protein